MVLFRHPADYKLIAPLGQDYENVLHGHKCLMRLDPNATTPAGYVQVDSIRGQSVYKENGDLLDRFMGLPRHTVGSWQQKDA